MKNIYKSLAGFQEEVPVIHESTKGYNYTYSNINTIFEVIKPLLKKYGLGFTQLLEGDSLKTIIFHVESGETIESSVNIPQNVKLSSMNHFQVIGSAITYYRRYSLSAALGLITDKDIDSGGEEKKTLPTTKEPESEKSFIIPDTKSWNGAVKQKASIETVKKHYDISVVNEIKYKEEIK